MKVVEGAHRVERPGSPKGFDVHVEDEMSREVGVRRVRLAPASRLYRSRTAEKVRDRYSRVDGESDETEKEGPQFLPILVAWEPGLTKADFDPAESELDFATRVSSNIATTRSSSVSAKESCASPPPTWRFPYMSEEVKRKTIALIDHLPKHRQTLLRQMLAFCLKSVCDREEVHKFLRQNLSGSRLKQAMWPGAAEGISEGKSPIAIDSLHVMLSRDHFVIWYRKYLPIKALRRRCPLGRGGITWGGSFRRDVMMPHCHRRARPLLAIRRWTDGGKGSWPDSGKSRQ